MPSPESSAGSRKAFKRAFAVFGLASVITAIGIDHKLSSDAEQDPSGGYYFSCVGNTYTLVDITPTLSHEVGRFTPIIIKQSARAVELACIAVDGTTTEVDLTSPIIDAEADILRFKLNKGDAQSQLLDISVDEVTGVGRIAIIGDAEFKEVGVSYAPRSSNKVVISNELAPNSMN